MTRLIAPTRLWKDGRFETGLAVEIEAGAIDRIRPLGPRETPDLTPHLLIPALTDLQVNGSGGVMLNSDASPAAIETIIAAQRRLGTGFLMPTLITTTAERMRATAEAVIEAWGMPGLLGLHLEGPHLNPERKGTHDATHMRPMDRATLAILERLRAADIPVMLTLAPEIVPPDLIREIAAMGVVVSAGHSAADAAETEAGLAAGIACFTHLYNAMPPMTSRAPGLLGTALASDAYAGIIVDGHHVSWPMVAIACRARPLRNRTFLVSDAMATVGGPDHFVLYGEEIRVRDGALVNAAGALAGAHVDLLTCLRNAVFHVGLPLEEAVAMATDIPNAAMRLVPPTLEPGRPVGEILALDTDLTRIGI
ncbi:N-acetylglucosamine-6-phosphate deacetylase [Afifella aestuarii]|uniref:N-acetylglucosamine-6-phosphate deacetylase n=1 Tax=Afifella aestuarii TaxID=1909496 RepID=UPI000FE42D11|nr:N-acetylglucosamine-6-phosphate deacetylase [Afifella aestuarii]